MKKVLLILLTLVVSLSSNNLIAQSWNTLGAAQFTNDPANVATAVDESTGNLYVAYVDQSDNDHLKVKYYDGSAWADLGGTVSQVGNVLFPSIRVNPVTNEVWVAYRTNINASSRFLMVKRYDVSTTSWVTEGQDIGVSGDKVPTQKIIIRFSPTGEFYVAYKGAGVFIYVRTNKSGSWATEATASGAGDAIPFGFDYPKYSKILRMTQRSSTNPERARVTVHYKSGASWASSILYNDYNGRLSGYSEGFAANRSDNRYLTHDGSVGDIQYYEGETELSSVPNSASADGKSLQMIYNPLNEYKYLLYVKTDGEVVVNSYDGSAWADVPNLNANIGATSGNSALKAKLSIRKSDGRVFVTYQDGSSLTTKYFDPTPPPNIVYVDQSATLGNNDGTSWQDAFTSLQDALDLVNTSSTDTVFVAQGTYKPHASTRTESFRILDDDVKIYGGFSGSETEISQRNINANPTIISGDLNGNDDPNDVTYSSFTRLDNSYRLVSVGANDVEINGFTLTGAHGNGTTTATSRGGAINKFSPNINLTVKNCIVKDNVAEIAGGLHLTNDNNGDLTIESCQFSNNFGRYGAGLNITATSGNTINVTVNNSLFFNNTAGDVSNGDGYSGSSMTVLLNNNSTANVIITNNTFSNNYDLGTNASNDKGTVILRRYVTGDVIAAEVHNNIFWNNYVDASATVNTQSIGQMNGSRSSTLNFTHNNTNQTNLTTKAVTYTASDNQDTDPLFMDEVNFDFALQSTSTMVDAGDNGQIPSGVTTDLRGFNRTFNTTVDLGAYEYFLDNTAPTVATKDITVFLDENGTVTVNPAAVDDGSTDDIVNAQSLNFSLDKSTFGCADLGTNTVNLTVSDLSGNSATGTAVITVEDNEAPNAVAQDITVNLDANGVATVDPNDVDNGSTDNCGIAEFNVLNNLTYDCNDLGENTDYFQVVDNGGSTSSIGFTVTVVDNIQPTAVAQDITVQLDANGSVEIQAEDLDNGSSDNCSVASFTADITTFDCNNLGANTVTLTATDGSGNTSTTTATVTVEDGIAPTVVTQDLEFEVGQGEQIAITAQDVDNGTSDNCDFTLSLDKTSFTLADLGENTVTLTAEDAAGNTATATASVTIIQSKEAQTITFDALAAKTYGDAAFELTASASSNLQVDFEVVDGPVSLDGNEVSITGTGNVTIRAIQNGNDEYEAADPVEQSFVIQNAAITVSAENKEMIYGEEFPTFTYQIDGFVYNEDASVLTSPVETSSTANDNSNVGQYDIIVSGAAADNYNISYEAAVLTILQASQEITFEPIADVDIEQTTTLTLSASAASGLAVSFEVLSGPATLNGNTLNLTGVGAVSIAASQAGNDNYEAAETLTQSFDVFSSAKEDQTISFDALPSKTYGDASFELSATASSGLPVSFSSSDETVATVNGTTVTILTAGNTIITASQGGNDEYNPATSVSQELVVSKADQQITIEEIEDKDIEAADFEVIATITSGLELTYTVLSGPATIDNNVVSLTGEPGSVEIEVTQAGNSNYNAASASAVFEVVEDPCIGFEASITVIQNVSCNGDTSGSFEVTVSNGTAPFTYSIGSESQDNRLFENQAAGSYDITVTDANGCTAVSSVEITEPDAITITAEITDSNSINGNGSIELTVTGGTGNHTFDWSNGATGQNLADLGIGEYTVIVTDEAGCSITENYTIGGVTANREEFEVSIYPNPVINQVEVVHGEKVNHITLLNATGKIISQSTTTGKQTEIEMSGLPAGLYFIRLDNGKMNRIIKQ